MTVVEQFKRRIRRAAEALAEELRVSHGIENVSIAVSETAKSITVTIRESEIVDDDESATE